MKLSSRFFYIAVSVIGLTASSSTAASTISIGRSHACALSIGGEAYCWGRADGGELGDGDTEFHVVGTPVAVQGDLSFSQITVNHSYSCGLTTSGAAYCWGSANSGELGDGDTGYHEVGTPTAVQGGLSFSQISAGPGHACALTNSGAAYCWGSANGGELGDGDTGSHEVGTPTAVQGGLSFSQISAGSGHTCALTDSGAAYCWGTSDAGELGDGDTGFHKVGTPTAVQGGRSFSQISAGSAHTCALTNSGAAYCWGSSNGGELGDGDTSYHKVATPAAVQGGLVFSEISAGHSLSCALTNGGSAYCWGTSDGGELGDGDTGFHEVGVPTAVLGGLTFYEIATGGYDVLGMTHSDVTCGKTTDGNAYCWGQTNGGELGDGDTEYHKVASPTLVLGSIDFSDADASAEVSPGVLWFITRGSATEEDP